MTNADGKNAESNPAVEVRQDVENSRFVVTVDGHEAGFAAYNEGTPSAGADATVEPAANVREFDHTEIYPEFQGRGLSKPLIQAALDATRTESLKVVPTCSAVQGFIDKTPDYQDMVAEG
ncbi:N-acetyltransferase [Corynebacterium incognita]|uniref:N-acetyltransferase n=1 Tax=Corynebacterium incognita TaxID=2754725 RepID=A0A7G7CR98_9CORY|nr:GNAT family N-acetyltransferase [Corynebacterium incognita]QNE90114.1 N-acetyltransferase [Corynebacterium incognita]